MNNYSYKKSIIKGIKYPLIIVIGYVLMGLIGDYPQYAEMTVGGLLIVIYDFVKRKVLKFS